MIPVDVGDAYARLYGVRREAQLRQPADTPRHEAKRRHAEWIAEIETRIETLRAQRNGLGQPLARPYAIALAGRWYTWYVKQYEDGPGPEKRWRELSDHPLLYQLSLEFDFSRPPRFVEPRLQRRVETQHKIPVVCGQVDRARIHLKEGHDPVDRNQRAYRIAAYDLAYSRNGEQVSLHRALKIEVVVEFLCRGLIGETVEEVEGPETRVNFIGDATPAGAAVEYFKFGDAGGPVMA